MHAHAHTHTHTYMLGKASRIYRFTQHGACKHTHTHTHTDTAGLLYVPGLWCLSVFPWCVSMGVCTVTPAVAVCWVSEIWSEWS